MKALVVVGFVLALSLFSGCSISGSYGHVEQFEMEALASPELRGAGGFREPNTTATRLTANVHMGNPEKERLSGIVNKKGNCGNLADCEEYKDIEVNENVDATYRMGFPVLTASLDFVYKHNLLMLGGSASIDKGVFGNAFMGLNTKFFEIGAAAGLWIHRREFTYSGTDFFCVHYFLGGDELEEGSFESSTSVGQVAVYGGFASAYYGPLSLSFSFSVYRPDPAYPNRSNDNLQAKFAFPRVMTEYIVAGYRLNDSWEFRVGAANTFGEFPGWHWSVTGGVSYYPK